MDNKDEADPIKDVARPSAPSRLCGRFALRCGSPAPSGQASLCCAAQPHLLTRPRARVLALAGLLAGGPRRGLLPCFLSVCSVCSVVPLCLLLCALCALCGES